jgi:hypothetical protein
VAYPLIHMAPCTVPVPSFVTVVQLAFAVLFVAVFQLGKCVPADPLTDPAKLKVGPPHTSRTSPHMLYHPPWAPAPPVTPRPA